MNDRSVDSSGLLYLGSGDYLYIRGDYIEVWDDAAGITIKVGGIQHQPPDPDRDETFHLVCRGGDYQQKRDVEGFDTTFDLTAEEFDSLLKSIVENKL